MSYLNLDLDYREHPKTIRLIGLISPEADVYPIRLWAFCGKYFPKDGCLEGYSEAEVEGAVGWRGQAGKLIAAMLKTGFIGKSRRGFFCHDWKMHNGHIEALKSRNQKVALARWKNIKNGQKDKTTDDTNGIPQAYQKGNPGMPLPTIPSVPSIPSKPTTKEVVVDASIRMPWGKANGVLITAMEPGYCSWLLKDEEMIEVVRKTPGLEEALKARVHTGANPNGVRPECQPCVFGKYGRRGKSLATRKGADGITPMCEYCADEEAQYASLRAGAKQA